MKGKLVKINNQWFVEYCFFGDNCPSKGAFDKQNLCDIRVIPLHPSDEQYAEEGKEVEFETSSLLMPDTPKTHAKLILPKQKESWDDISKEYDDYFLNVTGKNPTICLNLVDWLEENYHPPPKKK